jgi:hypothetical protein
MENIQDLKEFIENEQMVLESIYADDALIVSPA